MKMCGIIFLLVGLTLGVREYYVKTTSPVVFPTGRHGELPDDELAGKRRAKLILWGAVSVGGLVLFGIGKLRERSESN